MTQEIIEMARDSGMELYGLGKDRARFVHHLVAFANLVAAKALAEHAMQEVQRLGQEIEQEPVAIKRMKEWIEYLKRKSDFGQHMKIPSEMSAGACWELALELEQFINTTPSKRTWVNLTDEDRNDCLVEADPCECLATPEAQELMRCVEAKLKELNHGK